MYAFEYHRPNRLADAVALLKDDDEADAIAGGQTLLQTMRQRLAQPSDLVDLGAIDELRGVHRNGVTLTLGALSRHAEVAASAEVRNLIPALGTLAGRIGDAQVRNMGTLGGSIANNDPAADYPAALLALDATVVTTDREISADEFFLGLFETALEPGELIRAVRFTAPERAAYVKFAQPSSRFALVGVMVSEGDNGARVAVTGAADCVFRVPEMERALTDRFVPEAVASISIPPDDLNDDLHASPEYRAHLVSVVAARAVARALGEQQPGAR